MERIPYVVVFLRLSWISCVGTLHTCTLKMGSFQTFHCRTHFNGCRGCADYLLILYTGYSRNYSFYPVIEIGWAFCTINCVLLTAGTFLLFTCINRPEAPRFVTDMSKLSYGMYLMHIFWLGLWATVFKNTLELPTVAAIPCIAVTTFVCCYITTKIISFIPGSKWIIG